MGLTRAAMTDIIWEAACYHEAAHAVVGIHYGYNVQYIELWLTSPLFGDPQPIGGTKDDSIDCFDVAPEDDPRSGAEISTSIVVSFAGPAAQAWRLSLQPEVSPRRARRMVSTGAVSDMASIGDELGRLRGGGGLARRLEQVADDAVAAVRPGIVAVAEALRDSGGYLSGSQVYSLAR